MCWTGGKMRAGKEEAGAETVALMELVAGKLGRAGASVKECVLPGAFEAIVGAHGVVMNGGERRAMGWEMAHHRDALSATLREKLEWGVAQGGAGAGGGAGVFPAFADAFPAAMEGFDVLVTPSAPREAPAGLAWTGDPAFNLIWTSLHVPCVTVPAGVGPNGMPLGIQIVGRCWADRAVLAWAQWVAAAIG